jgi:hypothetical protein
MPLNLVGDSLMSLFWGYSQIGMFDETKRGAHLFDSGAHFFEVCMSGCPSTQQASCVSGRHTWSWPG